MVENSPQADEKVNELYRALRNKHGEGNSKANGYLWHGYFLREQKLLFSLLESLAPPESASEKNAPDKNDPDKNDPDKLAPKNAAPNKQGRILLDVGCGSGLMCSPLVGQGRLVVGVDFNEAACVDAKANGIEAIRGDAFGLPVRSNTVDEIVTCQFFNQQSPQAVSQFIEESARVLRPGGRVIMIWRNGEALIHRLALTVFRLLERIRHSPSFPYENHAIAAIIATGCKYELQAEYSAVFFPPCSWVSEATDTLAARMIGASSICILRKPQSDG